MLPREADRWPASSEERLRFSPEHPRGTPSQRDVLGAWVLLAISFHIFWEEKHLQLPKNEVSFFFLFLVIVLFVCLLWVCIQECGHIPLHVEVRHQLSET